MPPSCRLLLLGLLLAAPPTTARAQSEGYYRFPAIHGDRVAFSAEGDLWLVAATGGLAHRLTRHDGMEGHARFSPDGRLLAFTAAYDGNVDVYVMPAEGGEPRRLTFHPDADQVVGFTADGAAVVFRSRRASPHGDLHLFTVQVEGGQPAELPIGPAATASLHPDGRRIAFNRFPHEMANWRGYRGGTAQDVWLGDLAAGTFRKLTDWEGSDRFPMFDTATRHGIVFVSDRAGVMNLCALDPKTGDVFGLTRHQDFPVAWPDLHDGRVVYAHGADLRLFDLRTGEDGKIEVRLPSDRARLRPRPADAARHVESYALDQDGGKIVVSTRGELFLAPVPVDEGRVIALTRTPGVRERAPAFAPDGKRIACVSDAGEEPAVALIDAAGKEAARLLPRAGQGWINGPVWSPKGTHVACSDHEFALHLVEVASGAGRLVDRAEGAEITEIAFSADGRFLAYAKVGANEFSSIFIHDVEAGRSVAVTSPFTHDTEPVFDLAGRYLYFLSARSINPVLGEMDMQHVVVRAQVICATILAKDGRSPFLPKTLRAPQGDDKPDGRPAADKEAKDQKEAAPPPVKIDFDGIAERVVEFPLPAGDYSDLGAARGRVFYVASPIAGLNDMELFAEDESSQGALHAFDLDEQEDEVLLPGVRDYRLSGDGAKIAWRSGKEIRVAPSAGKIDADEADEIDLAALPLKVDPALEWAQIFREAWQLQRDFYWAENMAEVDWDGVRRRYERLLPRISTRDELNDLLSQMILELGTSHTYTFGGDLEGGKPVATGALGADLERDAASGYLRFVRVLRPETFETAQPAPLLMSHAAVREGDYLFAVNGVALGRDGNVHAALEGLAGRQVLLAVGSDPDPARAREIEIEALDGDQELRYLDWCRRNREYVDRASGGRLGYFHMPDMMGDGLTRFIKGFYPQIEKEGLVIDARHNGGGFVSQMVIERLMRRPVSYFKARRGPGETNPSRVHVGHKAVLTNQMAGSDGDIFPMTFQQRGLGPVIGMRTWGGVVGIDMGHTHVDGGMTTQPTAAYWDPVRGFSLENHGVTPDIEVDILPEDWRAGRDPQLDRAIEYLLKKLESAPVAAPPVPPVPRKK